MKKISIFLVLLLSYVSSVFAPIEDPLGLQEVGPHRHGANKEGEMFFDALDPEDPYFEKQKEATRQRNENAEQEAQINQKKQEADGLFKQQKMELLEIPDSFTGVYDPTKSSASVIEVMNTQKQQAVQKAVSDQNRQRIEAGLPTVTEVVSGEPLFEQAPLDNGITPQDLQALIGRAQTPGEAQNVLNEIRSDSSIRNKRDVVAAVASHVLKNAVDAVFGKDPLTPLELTKREEDLKALLAVDVLTEGKKAFMEQLLNELKGVTEKTISLQPDIVITTLSQAENAFRSGIISQEDGWNIAMEIKQKLVDADMLTPEMNNRITKSIDVFNSSSGRDAQVLVVPLPPDISTVGEFIDYIKGQVDSYKKDSARAFGVRKNQILNQMNQAKKILPTPTSEELKVLNDIEVRLNVIYEQKRAQIV